MRISRYFHTLRHLRPIQIYSRVQLQLKKPDINLHQTNTCRSRPKYWIRPIAKNNSLIKPFLFSFLNEEHELNSQYSWNHPEWKKLWLYNLHYFDDLNARDAEKRNDWHKVLILRWIEENPPPVGIGWEPYPLSLRIVNWIKWVLAGNTLPATGIQSLAVQVRFLRQRLETHLLGNHLIKNGVALLFAGIFFQGEEAEEWINKGMAIIQGEAKEQVLADGGHFERSPMYHCIVLEDFLDCLNLLSSSGMNEIYPSEISNLKKTVRKMSVFLNDILNPDGSIPLLNDSAYGIAPEPAALLAYASRLGLHDFAQNDTAPFVAKEDFGLYCMRGEISQMTIDCGRIGPDYLPGHAHCDTLSFEFWVGGKPLIVDTGTFEYSGSRRHFDRSTASHNTVMIDKQEQHEIWGEHRVARRGYPIAPKLKQEGEGGVFEGGHTGYKRLHGSPLHFRSITLSSNESWEIRDKVIGKGEHLLESFLHFHPMVECRRKSMFIFETTCGAQPVVFEIFGADSALLEESFYCPEFGKKTRNLRLRFSKKGKLPLEFGYRIKSRPLASDLTT